MKIAVFSVEAPPPLCPSDCFWRGLLGYITRLFYFSLPVFISGITVNAVHPGLVQTTIVENATLFVRHSFTFLFSYFGKVSAVLVGTR